MELTGFEPVTSCLPSKRSSRLSYSPAAQESTSSGRCFFEVTSNLRLNEEKDCRATASALCRVRLYRSGR